MKKICTIFLLLMVSKVWGQMPQNTPKPSLLGDISVLNQAFSDKTKPRLGTQFALSKENSNELQTVFSGLFLVYKSFFSSQDNQRCSFHPSCSEYGLEAVKKLGVVRGLICTCDRLTRCNGFSPRQYEIDLDRRILKDPVSW